MTGKKSTAAAANTAADDAGADEAQMAAAAAALQTTLGKSTSGGAFADATVAKRDSLVMLRFDADDKHGPLGIKVGQVIEARLRGTHKLNSSKMIDGWDQEEIEYKDGNGLIQKKVIYTSRFYEFESLDGKTQFGIYANPFLNRVLGKLPTNAATPRVVERNPVVRLTFIGKLNDKDLLKKDYDFELSVGAVNVVKVEVQEGIKFDPYTRRVVNYLSDPRPVIRDGETMGGLEAAASDWEALERLNGHVPAGIEDASQASLAQ